MITPGTIKGKLYDGDVVIYQVELTIFKTALDEDKSSFTFEATAAVIPGVYEPYKEGDIVYVGFINHEVSNPVILGKMLTKTEEDASYYYANSLKVKDKVELPENTTVGDITGKDLITAMKSIENFDEFMDKFLSNINGYDASRQQTLKHSNVYQGEDTRGQFVWVNN